MNNSLNIFGSVLTYPGPSSNYRGESEENRTVLQKITKGGYEYPIISPEAMRNALREMLASYGLPCNRKRLHDQDQLAVEFKSFPDANEFADDFLLGFLVADQKAVKANKEKPYKRDSVLRMNLAVALTPYRFDATLNQSPLNAGDSPWKNASTSALLHREIAHTAFQYPFALHVPECLKGPKEWTHGLLKAIGELNGVAGGHARSYFEMAPRSIVIRLTSSLVAGFDTYGYDVEGNYRELQRIGPNDLPGSEFWLGGEICRNMPEEMKKILEGEEVHFFENPQKMLEIVAEQALGEG